MLEKITDKFPTISEMSTELHIQDSTVIKQCHTISDIDLQPASDCECPKHTSPPPHPKEPSVPATEENHEQFESTWLTTADPAPSTYMTTNHYL